MTNLTKLAKQIVTLRGLNGHQQAHPVPISKAALIQKIGSRHTGPECETIQKMHDLTLDLGAECHPLRRKAGARHSHADQGLVQRMHDDCAGLGATCKALSVDEVFGSQVMKDGEIIKGSAGSGNFGHDGRKGKKGGSGKGGGLRRIGAKKDTPAGDRKKAAKKFREKRSGDSEKVKAISGSLNVRQKKALDVFKKEGKLGVDIASIPGTVKGKNVTKVGADTVNVLLDNKLIRQTSLIGPSGLPRMKVTELGEKVLGQQDSKPKKPPAKKKATKPLGSMSTSELNIGFLNAKNHKERVGFAEALLKGFSDNTVATSKKDIPKSKDSIQPGPKEIADKGKNAIFRLSGGAMGVGKVLEGVEGKHFNGNFGQVEQVTPVFKSDLTTKAQSDAPNYKPASTPQRCKNCKHLRGDPGEDYCTLFDFTADQDYVCDDWVAQRPDEIPGYRAISRKGGITRSRDIPLELKDWNNSSLSQRKGRDAVNNAIKAGILKKASTKKCFRCRKRPGAEYHHIDGYIEGKKLNVRPVCNHCHAKITYGAEANKGDFAALVEGVLTLRGESGALQN